MYPTLPMIPAMSADQVAQDWTNGKTLAAGKRTGHQHRRLAAGKVGKRFHGTYHGYGFLPDGMQRR